ncbi:MAG: hypothetical protein SGJ27_10970 [Candidatus Melainabacteria bacterium]|nr:hypothetical protein [Candidatus Melainabacteria bacterium]
MTERTSDVRRAAPRVRKHRFGHDGYTAALAHGTDRSRYFSPELVANPRRGYAYTRQRDWVWVPSRNMWLLATPGARTEEKAGMRPFGPLGIGQQPQIFNKRMADGSEMLTDYFGNPYKAPKVLGMLR